MNGREISEIFGCLLLVLGVLVVLVSLLVHIALSGATEGGSPFGYLQISSATVGVFFIASGAFITWKR
jgi:uncharacterized membrane protein YcjF (UPF0283 family)